MCQHAAQLHSYPSRRLVTVHGVARLSRAYYYGGRCHPSYLPYAEVREELRKLMGYFENHGDRPDDPCYRQQGWDIGSGPTEGGCQIMGERLKGLGMRWVEDGAATVAALRAW